MGDRRIVLPSPIFSDVVVEADGRRARALFRVEGEGTAGDLHLGYVGGEQLELTLGSSGWEPAGGVFLPRLESLIPALEARRAAASKRDAVALAALAVDPGAVTPAALPEPPLPVRAWFVRVEGDRAVVSEVDGSTASPVTHRMELTRVKDGWRFTSGLM